MSAFCRIPPPSRLRAFLSACFDAGEQVEILLHLRRSGAASTCRAVAVAFRLRESVTRVHLEVLTARGLLAARAAAEMTYRFAPRTRELSADAASLDAAFRDSRHDVLGFVAACTLGPARPRAHRRRPLNWLTPVATIARRENGGYGLGGHRGGGATPPSEAAMAAAPTATVRPIQ